MKRQGLENLYESQFALSVFYTVRR